MRRVRDRAVRPQLAALLVMPLLLALLAVVACGQRDPRQRILEERARWNVTLLSWAQETGGAVNLGVRLSGPPASSLDRLTVRVQLYDASEALVHGVWHTFDLSTIQRGGPADRSVRIPDLARQVAGASIDRVLDPPPELMAHIAELRDAAAQP